MSHALDHWKWVPDPLNRKRKIRVDPDTGQRVTQKHIAALKTQRDLSNLEDIKSKMKERFAASDKLRMDRWKMTGARTAGMPTQVDPSIYDMTADQKRKYTAKDGQYFKSQGHLEVFLDEDQAAVQKSLGEADASNIITHPLHKEERSKFLKDFPSDGSKRPPGTNERLRGIIAQERDSDLRAAQAAKLKVISEPSVVPEAGGSSETKSTKSETLEDLLERTAKGHTLTNLSRFPGMVGGKNSIANEKARRGLRSRLRGSLRRNLDEKIHNDIQYTLGSKGTSALGTYFNPNATPPKGINIPKDSTVPGGLFPGIGSNLDIKSLFKKPIFNIKGLDLSDLTRSERGTNTAKSMGALGATEMMISGLQALSGNEGKTLSAFNRSPTSIGTGMGGIAPEIDELNNQWWMYT